MAPAKTHFFDSNSACIYLLKVNNRNARTICSKLTIKTLERWHWSRSSVFIANFEHVSHIVLAFLLLTLNMKYLAGNHFCKIVVRDLLLLHEKSQNSWCIAQRVNWFSVKLFKTVLRCEVKQKIFMYKMLKILLP